MELYMYEVYILLIVGFIAGIFSGALGIGGGIVIVPLLVGLVGYSQKLAQGTSIGLLSLPIVLGAAINYYKSGFLNPKSVIVMVLPFVLGSYFSSKYAISLPDVVIKRAFGAFLMLYSIRLLTTNQ